MNQKIKKYIMFTFIGAQIVLIFLALFGVGGNGNKFLEYSSIVLSLVFCFSLFLKTKDWLFLCVALFLVSIADIFLIILGIDYQLEGLIFFNLAQFVFSVRLFSVQKQNGFIVHISIRLILSVLAALLPLCIFQNVDAVLCLSFLYGVNIILNLVYSFIQIRKNLLFPIGMFLFVLCDLVVGISCASPYIPELYKAGIVVSNLGFSLSSLFYLPAIALLALSSLSKKEDYNPTINENIVYKKNERK